MINSKRRQFTSINGHIDYNLIDTNLLKVSRHDTKSNKRNWLDVKQAFIADTDFVTFGVACRVLTRSLASL